MNFQNKHKFVLAIETSGKICSVALAELNNINDNNININTDIICEYNIYEGNKHDKFCAELCSRVLKDNNILPAELFAVAVSAGPGSFTGLRIGVAIAKGMCFDEKIKLIAVSTLNAIAFNAKNNLENLINNKIQNIIAVIPSHSNLCYYKSFINNDFSNNNEIQCKLTPIEEIITLAKQDNNIIVSNQKIALLTKEIQNNYPTFLQNISATAIANYAVLQVRQNDFANPAELVPLYSQNFEVK